jgi:hypothetical protein
MGIVAAAELALDDEISRAKILDGLKGDSVKWRERVFHDPDSKRDFAIVVVYTEESSSTPAESSRPARI